MIVDKIWLHQYQTGISEHIDIERHTSLNGLFAEAFEKYSKQVCFSNMGTHLSFEEIEKRSRYLAIYLQHLSLSKGARIALMMPNILQYPIAILGILRAGYTVVNTNPLYTSDELTTQFNDAKVEAVIVLSQCVAVLKQSLENIPSIKHVITTNVGDCFRSHKRYLINTVTKIMHPSPAIHHPHVISFLDALSEGRQGELKPAECQPDDLAFLQYTGGTTGRAKGAMLTHRNMMANIAQTSMWISPKHFGIEDTVITALPLYHIFSLTANFFLFFTLGVRNILITDARNTKALLKQIRTTPPTAITGVNTLYASLLHHDSFDSKSFAHLKIALSGGMSLNESVSKRWKTLTGHPLIEAYGLTEASPAVCINPLNHPHPGSIGLPLPSTEISIRNTEGKECDLGDVGELCIRGPQIMQGYWQHPEETAAVFWPDGFLRSGDSVRMDEKGYIYVVDRIKDLIIVSGFNVYPSEIEEVIAQMPQVLEVGVIGARTKSGNDRIKACVVANDPNLTTKEVLAHCRKHLTGYKIPKIVEFYPELPKSNIGKILKRMLK